MNNTVKGRRKSSRQVSAVQTNHDPTCSLKELTESRQFAAHTQYTCNDATLGFVLLQLAVNNSSGHAHVYSMAGSMAVADLDLSVQSPLRKAVVHMSDRSDTTRLAMAMVMSLYISRISKSRRKAIMSRVTGLCEWDDKYAARIAASMEVSKLVTLPALLNVLEPLHSKTIQMDIIAGEDSPLRSLMLPVAPLKDKDHDIDKCPPPPATENSEKRENLIHEILATERTYVARLKSLIDDYAVPMRAASRRGKGFIGTYETNALFPNTLDAILLLNTDFLRALEGSDSDFQFASVLVKNFGDFRKVYARYLETSSDLDHILRNALKQPKFKEFTDEVRARTNAVIGIRELVIEPISRVPRYSLLISSLLAVITPSNPAYSIFRQALAIVKRIGHMERDQSEVSQELLMKLAGVVSSWPAELIRSSVQVLGMVDCLDVMIADGQPSSLILLSDRIVLLKRGRGSRLDEILQASKKGECGYRGYILLDSVTVIEGEDAVFMFLSDEPFGVQSERWVARPMRKYSMLNSDASKFAESVRQAQAELKSCEDERCGERLNEYRFNFALYKQALWKEESLKYPYRIWEDVDDGDDDAVNVVVTHNLAFGTYDCKLRHGDTSEMVCKDVSQKILKDAILETILQHHKRSWLDTPVFKDDLLLDVFSMCAANLQTQGSPAKSRPRSPAKIVSSFLSRSPPRPSTAGSARSVNSVTKKKSIPFFSGSDTMDKFLVGVTTFMDSMQNFEEFTKADFTTTSATEGKQVVNLANSILKDPRKGFAILGSPAKTGIHAYRSFVKAMLKKAGMTSIVTEQTCQDLRSHAKHEPNIRRTRFRTVISALPNLSFLRCLLRYGHHVVGHTKGDSIAFLLILSDMLVPALLVTSFVSTLEILIQDFDFIFFSFEEFDVSTVNSLASGMSLKPRYGSISSHYNSSHYNSSSHYQTGTSTSMSRSPAKQSSFGTPDLIVASSIEDAQSTSSAEYERSSHREAGFDNSNIFGLTASESHLPLEKELPCPPLKFEGLSQKTADILVSQIRRVTPSKIPVPSPRVPSPSPRIPSPSPQLDKSVSSDLDSDFVLALQSLERDSSHEELPLPPTKEPSDMPRSVSREFLKRELQHSGISSSDTIRRVSKQLQETSIGALPLTNKSPRQYTGKQLFRCNGDCVEKISLLELELSRYKDLYRNACEEVDVTLDLANEEIAVLQEAQAKDTFESTLLGLLELEKEKVRKLRKTVMSLKGGDQSI